ncbi:hypothetical protein HOC90_04205 [Candidatus Falkowbacteria bacterium]|jgi:hypothetical protein|nr:hypothetical protein [Elusimicrobiaceae bacterium]MBT4433519.1 hypothetical protein [Candidatus Falkowbacteria bacterium]
MILNEDSKKNQVYNFTVKYFSYFIFIFVILVSFFVYKYYFKDYIYEIREINNRKINLQEEIHNELSYFLEKLKKAEENLSLVSDRDIKKINIILPIEDQKTLLFYYLDNLVKDNGMELKFIKFSNQEYKPSKNKKTNTKDEILKKKEEDVAKNISKLKISMKISGVNYEKLKLFLGSIENNLRLIDIDFFNFSSLDNGDLNVQATAYYEPVTVKEE